MSGPAIPSAPLGRALLAGCGLAFVAGFVDVVGFVALFGLFTAHVTGNFVLIGAEIVHSGVGVVAKLFALPVFIVMVVAVRRSEEHTSELQSLMRISYAVFCLK